MSDGACFHTNFEQTKVDQINSFQKKRLKRTTGGNWVVL